MLKKISFKKNILAANIFHLASGELLSKIFSLITFAYLARALSVEGFGILGFAAAFISFFLLFANFGTDTIAAREIAKNKGSISNLVDEVFSLRLIIALIVIIIYSIVLFFISLPITTKIVFAIFIINILSNAFSINWFFQGIEEMKYISRRQVLSNLSTLILIYFFVKDTNDLILAAFILTVSNLINVLLFIHIYRKKFNRLSIRINQKRFKEIIIQSYPVAVSAFMIAIYYHLDMVMLGYMKPESDVGIYNAAYKIFITAIIPFQIILYSIFPELSRIGISKSEDFFNLIKKYALLLIPAGIFSALILFLFSEELITILFGIDYILAAAPLSILAVNTLIVSLNMFFGNPLIAWGEQKKYSIIISLGAVSNIIFNILFIPDYSYIGAAFATLLSEIVVLIGLIFLHNIILKIRLA